MLHRCANATASWHLLPLLRINHLAQQQEQGAEQHSDRGGSLDDTPATPSKPTKRTKAVGNERKGKRQKVGAAAAAAADSNNDGEDSDAESHGDSGVPHSSSNSTAAAAAEAAAAATVDAELAVVMGSIGAELGVDGDDRRVLAPMVARLQEHPVIVAELQSKTNAAAALQTQIDSIAQELDATGSSAEAVSAAIKALQDAAAAAQRERAEALAKLQTANDDSAKLQTEVSAAQQEKLDSDARAGQLSTESTDLKAKLSSAETELGQKTAANAALTTANTELEEKAAATAESTALLSTKLCSLYAMLKEALPGKVSNICSNYCSTILVYISFALMLYFQVHCSCSLEHLLLMYCALLSLPQKYELAQPDAVLGMDSVLGRISLMLQELVERQDALQSAAAAAKTGTDISHQWTVADFNSVTAVVGSKSCSAAAVLEAAGAQRDQLATTKDEITALTQHAGDLGSAVCTFVLDLGKTLGVEVSLRLR
jgi:predicted  nucleic acid-binding Zn-ribbon protein